MRKWEFRAEDFLTSSDYMGNNYSAAAHVAAVANAKLKEWLNGAPTVYGWDHRSGYVSVNQKVDEPLHWSGKIVDVVPIKESPEALLKEIMRNIVLPKSFEDRIRRILGFLI